MVPTRLRDRLGWATRLPARSLTFWITDPALLLAAAQLAAALHRRFPRTPIVFVQRAGAKSVTGFTNAAMPLVTSLLLQRLRTQTLVLVGRVAGGDADPRPASYARGASLVLLPGNSMSATTAIKPDAIVDPARITENVDAVVSSLEPLLVRSRKETMEARGHLPLEARLLRNSLLRRLLRWKMREYASIAALREALGAPRSILCLGNGPSSELPELSELSHDRLFRVNLLWNTRVMLREPDLVFTGLAEAVTALRPSAGFVFGNIRKEEKILSGALLSSRRFRYATAERLGLLPSYVAGTEPTNGALMLATAIALRPERLIVAGIDLYRHPAGVYPGDATTENRYAAGHDADAELRLILDVLGRHEGELLILGEPLRLAWEKWKLQRS